MDRQLKKKLNDNVKSSTNLLREKLKSMKESRKQANIIEKNDIIDDEAERNDTQMAQLLEYKNQHMAS
ncbi:hypothetical protein SNEBB_001382 [Seison nebaliae]|nr:hypothetical protein SNEBB_001382 [Seison nebaliae]